MKQSRNGNRREMQATENQSVSINRKTYRRGPRTQIILFAMLFLATGVRGSQEAIGRNGWVNPNTQKPNPGEWGFVQVTKSDRPEIIGAVGNLICPGKKDSWYIKFKTKKLSFEREGFRILIRPTTPVRVFNLVPKNERYDETVIYETGTVEAVAAFIDTPYIIKMGDGLFRGAAYESVAPESFYQEMVPSGPAVKVHILNCPKGSTATGTVVGMFSKSLSLKSLSGKVKVRHEDGKVRVYEQEQLVPLPAQLGRRRLQSQTSTPSAETRPRI